MFSHAKHAQHGKTLSNTHSSQHGLHRNKCKQSIFGQGECEAPTPTGLYLFMPQETSSRQPSARAQFSHNTTSFEFSNEKDPSECNTHAPQSEHEAHRHARTHYEQEVKKVTCAPGVQVKWE